MNPHLAKFTPRTHWDMHRSMIVQHQPYRPRAQDTNMTIELYPVQHFAQTGLNGPSLALGFIRTRPSQTSAHYGHGSLGKTSQTQREMLSGNTRRPRGGALIKRYYRNFAPSCDLSFLSPFPATLPASVGGLAPKIDILSRPRTSGQVFFGRTRYDLCISSFGNQNLSLRLLHFRLQPRTCQRRWNRSGMMRLREKSRSR